jgi:fatty acid desaturase
MAVSALMSVLDDPLLVSDVKQLSRMSNARAAWALLSVWLTIAAAIAAAAYLDSWWVYPPAIILVAARQHALGILVHDATHYRLFASRVLNDRLCDLFCAFPIGLTTSGYREDHIAHHRATNTPGDPYYNLITNISSWQWPKTRWEAARHLLAEVSGLNTVRNLRMSQPWTALGQWRLHRLDPPLQSRCRADLVATALFWLTVAAVLTVLDGWKLFFLLWVVPGLTFYQLFVRLRWMSEHPYELSTGDGYETNHVQGSFLERYCIAPFNVNYHVVHHLFPGTPFYRLPRVHQRLMRVPCYREQSKSYATYFGQFDSVWSHLVKTGDAATM